MISKIKNNLSKSIELLSIISNDPNIIQLIHETSQKIIQCYIKGNKVYFCGNGGSFSDAQHLSAELSGRFYFDRNPLEVVLLGSNFSYLTAVANDYSYDEIFSREIKSSFKATSSLSWLYEAKFIDLPASRRLLYSSNCLFCSACLAI